jgi:hypothetical protein
MPLTTAAQDSHLGAQVNSKYLHRPSQRKYSQQEELMQRLGGAQNQEEDEEEKQNASTPNMKVGEKLLSQGRVKRSVKHFEFNGTPSKRQS